MPKNETRGELRVGQTVTVHITRVLAGGLLVDIPGYHAKGLIRTRELAWETETKPTRQQGYHVGDSLDALVLGRRSDGRIELSRRLLETDPWADLTSKLRVGQRVEGTVTSVTDYGAFVELDVGVTGLLHVSQLPSWVKSAPAELFWPGDRVKVVIESIRIHKRRIGLSMLELAGNRWQKKDAVDGTAATPFPERQRPSTSGDGHDVRMRLPLELLLQRPPQIILVVEDDPEQRQAVAGWLRQAGQRVYTAGSGELAVEMLANLVPDVALVDVGLPGITGIETMHRLLGQLPDLHAAVMTDWSRANDHQAELEVLATRGIRLLLKPLLPVDLLEFLFDDQRSMAPGAPVSKEAASPGLIKSETPPSGRGDSRVVILQALQHLQRQTGAAKTVVFALDPVQRKVDIVAQVGREPLDQKALLNLVHSPVRDVAEDGLIVRTDDIRSADRSRFRYLVPLIPFASCIGVPITANVPLRYALFVFHPRSSVFESAHENAMIVAAAAVANVMERQSMIQQMGELQRLALLGQLTRALVHEVNHRLSPIGFALDTLKGQCQDIDRMMIDSPDEAGRELHYARSSLDHLAQAVSALVHTARLFGHMARVEREPQILLPGKLAEEVAEIVRDTANRDRVTIGVETPTHLHITTGQVTLVQQILLNVVLNAIQQISETRPKQGGHVRLWFEDKVEAGRPLVCINVEDDGPGIHRRLWDRIFELGFTTRKEGSGLGLHVSRSLAESLNGRVYVADSHILWGTTFTVEIPLKI